MSLDRVEEQIPLLLGELEALSSQVNKQIGLLSVQAENTLPELSEEMQLQMQRDLVEIEDLAGLIANVRCTELADQLQHKLAIIRSYLHE
ncbi:hypothetical protein [Vibrio profundi]|uniref:hypothetical protein n=1 Tax=Vibrio profundi TaxID=1774960 RepID=UPI0037369D93